MTISYLLENLDSKYKDNRIVKLTSELIDDPTAELDSSQIEYIKAFVEDEIMLAQQVAAHARKWSPDVYHEQVYIDRENGQEAGKVILEMLSDHS